MAGKLTKAGDVYAFGVLVWGMCMGKLPWAGLRPVQIIMQARHPAVRQHGPDDLNSDKLKTCSSLLTRPCNMHP